MAKKKSQSARAVPLNADVRRRQAVTSGATDWKHHANRGCAAAHRSPRCQPAANTPHAAATAASGYRDHGLPYVLKDLRRLGILARLLRHPGWVGLIIHNSDGKQAIVRTLAGFDTKRLRPGALCCQQASQANACRQTLICSGAARSDSQPVMTVSTIR